MHKLEDKIHDEIVDVVFRIPMGWSLSSLGLQSRWFVNTKKRLAGGDPWVV